MSETVSRRDVYRTITDQIAAAIERGAPTFEMPWHRGGSADLRPANACTGNGYRGINVVALWVAANANGFCSHQWATYRQWLRLGAQVQKGARGTVIVFYKKLDREVAKDETGELEMKTIYVARASYVFNAEQVSGWEEPARQVRGEAEVLDGVEAFVKNCGPKIEHEGPRAFYNPATDHIQMPDRDRFVGTRTSTATESYYSTLLHELTHWTAHKTRLDRNLWVRFGGKDYAMEELIAELGAAFLCADLGVSNVPRPDHAAYVGDWLTVLRQDLRAIFVAAGKATEAAEYLAGFQPGSEASTPRYEEAEAAEVGAAP